MCWPPSGGRTSATKPMPLSSPVQDDLVEPRERTTQMNKMFEVSTCRNSCCGCLRPPCGGTDAIVPSMSFSSAC